MLRRQFMIGSAAAMLSSHAVAIPQSTGLVHRPCHPQLQNILGRCRMTWGGFISTLYQTNIPYIEPVYRLGYRTSLDCWDTLDYTRERLEHFAVEIEDMTVIDNSPWSCVEIYPVCVDYNKPPTAENILGFLILAYNPHFGVLRIKRTYRVAYYVLPDGSRHTVDPYKNILEDLLHRFLEYSPDKT